VRVLVACEFSGIVREAFRSRGMNAWSLDLLPAEDGSAFHIQAPFGDEFVLGLPEPWDLMIAHPPCQYLSNAGNVWLRQPGRMEARLKAMDFFMTLANAKIERIAIENPRGCMSLAWRKPDQIIQPYEFGHPIHKPTCLWLKGLPLLKPTKIVTVDVKWDGKRNRHWVDRVGGSGESRRKNRSRTFQGIADAMAMQWSSR
jgi:hypothetical protein